MNLGDYPAFFKNQSYHWLYSANPEEMIKALKKGKIQNNNSTNDYLNYEKSLKFIILWKGMINIAKNTKNM